MRLGILLVCLVWASIAQAQQVKTFAWEPGTGGGPAEGYFLQTGTAPGATTDERNVGNVTTASVDFPAGTYYVRVLAYNMIGMSGASNEVTFTVAPPAPPPPPDPCFPALEVIISQWPPNKRYAMAAGRDYTSNFPIYRYVYQTKGQTVNAITWTDTRNCTDRMP